MTLEILQILAIKRRSDTIDQRRYYSLARGLDADTEEPEPLAYVCAVFLVAADTAHALCDEHIKSLSFGIVEKAFNPRAAVQRGARGRRIIIDSRDQIALSLRIVTAERNLVADRPGVLQVGREAGINSNAFHECVETRTWMISCAWSSLACARARASISFITAGSRGGGAFGTETG